MIDRTDEETGELVRAWLQRYGLAIISGIVLAIILIAGYEWWQNKQVHQSGEASTQLMSLSEAVSAGQLQEAEAIYGQLNDATLKPFASLLLATAYNGDAQYEQALDYFKQAAKSKDALVAQTANWQLAQLYMVDKDYASAKQTLQALKGSAYEQQIPLLNAVIAQDQGDKQAALDDYKRTLQGTSDQAGFIQAQISALEGELAVETEKEQ